MSCYTIAYTVDACPHQVKFILPGHIFTYLGFPECSCCIDCEIYSLLCVWTNDFRLTDGWWLFPSLYMYLERRPIALCELASVGCLSNTHIVYIC